MHDEEGIGGTKMKEESSSGILLLLLWRLLLIIARGHFFKDGYLPQEKMSSTRGY